MMCFTDEELAIILRALLKKEATDWYEVGSGEIVFGERPPAPERLLIDKIQKHLQAPS